MQLTRVRLTPRAVALIAFAVLSLGGSACGGSDEDGGDASASQPSGAEQEIRAAIAVMQKAATSADGKAMCSVMTPSSKETVKGFEDYPTCEEAMDDFLTDDRSGELKPQTSGASRVAGVSVRGDTGSVTLVTDGERRRLQVERLGDEWLVDLFGVR